MTFLEALREAELASILKFLPPPPARVIELGGGNGVQASLLAAHGYDVESFDLPGSAPAGGRSFPVREYNGKELPVEDGNADVVFSSNVLEHVPHLAQMLRELRRVAAPSASHVHIMPSTTWRLWTSLAHYPHGARLLFRALRDQPVSEGGAPPAGNVVSRRRSIREAVSRVVVSGPHGEYPSALHELWAFSAARWSRVFERNGYSVERIFPVGFAYTGHTLFPSLSLSHRRRLSRILGSSTIGYRLSTHAGPSKWASR